MDKNTQKEIFCDVCNITLPNAPSMKQHVAGQKHIKSYNDKEEERRIKRKCGIFVKGYPQDLGQDVILKYFSKFGKVVWTHFGNSFLLLDYSDPFDASNVMKNAHYLGGKYLTIKYRELRTPRSLTNYQVQENTSFIQQLKDVDQLEGQIQLLQMHLQVGSFNLHPVYQQICRDLHNSLAFAYPSVRIFPFGSTITGLGFQNSDVDVYIAGVRQGDNNVPFLYKIKNILLNSKRFYNCIVIANAKIPILKCVHASSNISCDINIKNMLGVCNSQLINYYLNMDDKIRKVMVIIKYWAKVHKISGQNHLFTNYSLSLMLIFFLQQEPHKVPSVLMLQQNRNFSNYQDGWNGGFEPQQCHISTIKVLSLAELLAAFFDFYSNFDYTRNVICPYLGTPVEKSHFKAPDHLPDHYKDYKAFVKVEGNLPLKVDTSVCIQDPFEHPRNTTPIVSDSILNIFVNFCRYGRQLCEQGERGLLYKLLTEEPPSVRSEMLTKANCTQFAIPMGVNVKYLDKTIDENAPDRRAALERAWFASVRKFLLIVLKDFLNMQVEELTKEHSNSKAKRVEGQADVHDKKKRVCSYNCSARLNLWQSRKSTLKNIENKGLNGVIETEMEVTKQLLELYKNVTSSTSILEFEITLQEKHDPVQVLVNITKKSSYKKTFRSFGVFFAANFLSWFETYEKESNVST